MAGHPSSQLQKVIDDKERYQYEARIAAIEELVKRQEATPELLEKKSADPGRRAAEKAGFARE